MARYGREAKLLVASAAHAVNDDKADDDQQQENDDGDKERRLIGYPQFLPSFFSLFGFLFEIAVQHFNHKLNMPFIANLAQTFEGIAGKRIINQLLLQFVLFFRRKLALQVLQQRFLVYFLGKMG